MSRVHILPEALRNKIAAGEMVEKPASVVKEFIENALDAGSTSIAIHVLHAGKRLIRVIDNGIGMAREDALLAFKRYSTSKISSEEDLLNLQTMGFRGEALSSISAVARVKMVTGQDAVAGTCIEVHGGEVKDISECSASGTAIEVRDLFFNTPARRKFLKSDGTENYHIIDTVIRAAIPHSNVRFVLNVDTEEVLNLSKASTLKERVLQIFGIEFIGGMTEMDSAFDGLMARLFISTPAHLRTSRNSQFLFVNNRSVRDPNITQALYKAFEGTLPKGKHPAYIMLLDIDPGAVDVNVHPTKREVRFQDANTVFHFVFRTARSALSGRLPAESGAIEVTDAVKGPAGQPEIMNFQSFSPSLPTLHQHVSEAGLHYNQMLLFFYVGDTFIAIKDEAGLMLIDYHAAHERINYERLLRKDVSACHQFLFPQHITLPANEHRIILQHRDLLYALGLEIEDFGYRTVILRSIPEILKDVSLQEMMSDIAAALVKNQSGGESSGAHNGKELFDEQKRLLAARLACHASIRGREIPDAARLINLLSDLNATASPDRCPHGRPTKIVLSLEELRRMFKK
jgi:DNA mismatch repair protein MutL